MFFVLATIALLALLAFPTMWVRYVMKHYGQDRADMPGTGGELAQHLVNRFELNAVSVEEAEPGTGDHYDPHNATVRLSASNFHGRSLTAVAVAAHEVGHAIQFQRQEPISRIRSRVVPLAIGLKKSGILLMYLVPLVAIIAKAPPVILGIAIVSFSIQLLGALAYLIVLPEEWDASFNKAMPILIEGDYIQEADEKAVRRILRAAALTYFSGALIDLVNLGRWLIILRR